MTILKILNRLKGEDESRSQSAVNPASISIKIDGAAEDANESGVTVGSK